MYGVIKAGTGQTAGTVDLNESSVLLKLRASVAAVVTLNGKDVALAVTAEYQDFPVHVTEFIVVSGTIDYVALG